MISLLFTKKWTPMRRLIFLRGVSSLWYQPSGDDTSDLVGTGVAGYMTLRE